MITNKRAIELLKEALSETTNLKTLHFDNQDFKLWRDKVRDTIKSALEPDDLERFSVGSFKIRGMFPESVYQREYLEEHLPKYEAALKSIIQKYEVLGIKEKPDDTLEISLKAFIAHEGETIALTKVTNFLIALRIEPIIAERRPCDSSLVEPHVASNLHIGDFVIILATKGKAINKKSKIPYMGLNVADELGRAREANKKVILLLENGVEPHTNISGILWENFTPQSMDKAFTKVARELTNWGFITAGITKEHSS